MPNIDHRDAIAGILLAILGASFALYARSHYSIGTVTRMGPGMVPFALGVILSVFGVLIAGAAFFRETAPMEYRVLTPLLILGSLVVFAFTISSFGLLPAVILSTLVASLADRPFRLVRTLILGAILCVAAYLIFVAGLQLPITLFVWPF